MNKSLLGSLGVLGLVLVAGCGSDDEGKESADLASYAAARCAAYQRCYPEIVSGYGGPERCPDRIRLSIESSILPGMTAEGSWLAGCISATKSASCEDVLMGRIAACQPPPGTLSEGSACSIDYQCATSACYQKSAPPACGACAVPVGLGESCEGAPCAKGLACAWGGESAGTCIEAATTDPDWKKVGDACGSPPYGSYCGPLLRCRNEVCALRAELGESCEAGGDCVSGAFCDTAEKLCKATSIVGEGKACDDTAVVCAGGLFCKGMAVCVAYLEDGAACENTALGGTPCLHPADCVDGICTLPTAPVCE